MCAIVLGNVTTFLADIGTFLAAVAACVGVFFAWKAVKQVRTVAEGQLFFALIQDYTSKEMLEDMILLGNLRDEKENKGEKWFQKWLANFEKRRRELEGLKKYRTQPNVEESHQIDEARRHVTLHFFSALNLHNTGCMTREVLMEEICDAWGFKLLFEIVEHLEQKINPQYARDKFDSLLQIAEDERTKEYLQKKRPKHFQDKNEPPGINIGSKT